MVNERQKKSQKEIYLDRHRKCGIKVGDKVKVIKSCKSFQRGWQNSWQQYMDEATEKVGFVVADHVINGFGIYFPEHPDSSGFDYPYFALKKIVDEKKSATERTCKSKAEAQALANFLWNEKQRHIDDIAIINEDLDGLMNKWGVWPTEVKVFVKP